MPGEEEDSSFGKQLETALEETAVSQRELARRLAVADGKKPESKRRWIGKLLNNQVERPEDDSVSAIAAALGLDPDYFTVPAQVSQGRRRATMAQIEEQLAAVRGENARLASRVEELERALQLARGDDE